MSNEDFINVRNFCRVEMIGLLLNQIMQDNNDEKQRACVMRTAKQLEKLLVIIDRKTKHLDTP